MLSDQTLPVTLVGYAVISIFDSIDDIPTFFFSKFWNGIIVFIVVIIHLPHSSPVRSLLFPMIFNHTPVTYTVMNGFFGGKHLERKSYQRMEKSKIFRD
jgi:hypothetical protein